MKQFLRLLVIGLGFLAVATAAKSGEITLDPDCTGKAFERSAEIGELVTQLRRFDTDMSGKGIFMAYPLLAHLNTVVSDTGTIETFRCQDDLQVVLKLVELTKVDDRTIRINASRLLANVTDNTTLCGVLDALAGNQLSDDARYNLWQVVYVVAGYARRENQAWIKAVITQQKQRIQGNAYPRISSVIEQTETALQRNGRSASLLDGYQPSYQACLDLPNLAAAAR